MFVFYASAICSHLSVYVSLDHTIPDKPAGLLRHRVPRTSAVCFLNLDYIILVHATILFDFYKALSVSDVLLLKLVEYPNWLLHFIQNALVYECHINHCLL